MQRSCQIARADLYRGTEVKTVGIILVEFIMQKSISRAALTQSTQDSLCRGQNTIALAERPSCCTNGEPSSAHPFTSLACLSFATTRPARETPCAQMSFHVERFECLRARRRVLSRTCRGVARDGCQVRIERGGVLQPRRRPSPGA